VHQQFSKQVVDDAAAEGAGGAGDEQWEPMRVGHDALLETESNLLIGTDFLL
jgi:hypothetical protein